MDLLKTKIYLDKLNREFSRMSKDPDNIARIDLDIMLSYVRELYDALLSESMAGNAPSEPAPVPKKHHAAKPAEPVEEAPAPASPPPPPPPPVTPPPPPPPPVVKEVVPPAAPPPPPVVEEKPAPAPPPPPPVVVEPEPVPVVTPKAHHSSQHPTEADLLFEEKQARELSEKLSELPIADLKRAIALNDRLLLTNELFAGDGQVFERTIGALNSFSSFDDAKAYLIENCVIRYAWTDKKRIESAKNFIKLVRRRYK